MVEKLAADNNTTHTQTKHVVEQAHKERDYSRDYDDYERVRDCSLIARPDDVRELFANMFQVGEW